MSDAGEKVALATRQRAGVYAHLFLVLRREIGEERTVELMSEAIRSFGAEKSKRNYSEEAQKGDLEGAAREFASPDPVKQHQFAPRIVSLEPRPGLRGPGRTAAATADHPLRKKNCRQCHRLERKRS